MEDDDDENKATPVGGGLKAVSSSSTSTSSSSLLRGVNVMVLNGERRNTTSITSATPQSCYTRADIKALVLEKGGVVRESLAPSRGKGRGRSLLLSSSVEEEDDDEGALWVVLAATLDLRVKNLVKVEDVDVLHYR